jgi:cellulose synthase (UDP-forming)
VNLTVTWLTWLLFYFGFYGLQILLAFNTMGSFRPETRMLASVSFPIYLKALVNVLIGKEESWHVTGGARRRNSPFNFMVPQVLTFTFLLLTSVVAIYKDLGNQTITLATAWNLTNTFILGAFVVAGVQEVRAARRAATTAPDVLTRPIMLDSEFGRPAHDARPASDPVAAPIAARVSEGQVA